MIYRTWQPADEPFLWEMLFASLHVPDGDPPFRRSVLEEPNIAHYLQGFGSQPGDDAQICETPDGAAVGAAWCRQFTLANPGYGFVSDGIPELAMAVTHELRGRGVGRQLLTDLLERNPQMSLSVDDTNFAAVALYQSMGFEALTNVEGTTTMLRSG